MSDKWSAIPIRTWHGKGVSRETANGVLSAAEKMWTQMGLTKRQISFGIGLMDIESGFNAAKWSGDQKYYGLGQFDAPTWEKAVEMYNKRYHAHIRTSYTSDRNVQVAVLRNWIQEMLWPRAEHQYSNPQLSSSHSLEDVAYALHNRGYNSSTERAKRYLDDKYKSPKPKQEREPDYPGLEVINPWSV